MSLVRKIMKVHPAMYDELVEIAARLKEETGVEYSVAAVVRGLLTIAITRLTIEEKLAPWFAGARVPRGRRRNGQQAEPELRVMPL